MNITITLDEEEIRVIRTLLRYKLRDPIRR